MAIQQVKNSQDELEAIDHAIAFEKDTLVFYYGFMDIVKEETKHVISQLVDEEKSHIVKLYEIKNKIKKS